MKSLAASELWWKSQANWHAPIVFGCLPPTCMITTIDGRVGVGQTLAEAFSSLVGSVDQWVLVQEWERQRTLDVMKRLDGEALSQWWD